jgi:hypothetical protein
MRAIAGLRFGGVDGYGVWLGWAEGGELAPTDAGMASWHWHRMNGIMIAACAVLIDFQ